MKHIQTNKWTCSADGEYFSGEFDSKADAIKDCEEYERYIGRIVELEFEESDMPNLNLNKEMTEILYDEIGYESEYYKMTEADENAINKMVAKVIVEYINEHNLQPSCYKVVDIEEVEVEEK